MKKNLLLVLVMIFLGTPLLWGQARNVSGTVGSEEGPGGYVGATVVVKGTALGTATDAKGNYSLEIPAVGSTLVFTAVGMQTVEETVGERTTINVRLKTDTKQLNEVVVTAIGTKTKRDRFASSVTTLDGVAVAKSGETSLLTGLSGKASEVLITRNGGNPGAGGYIQIRGQNTINGNIQPLFIVDGVPVSNASDNLGTATPRGNGIVQQSRINDINPEDIERMEVLKGASAVALWGTRAANGEIIITTKKGRDSRGKVDITVKSTVSFDRVNKSRPCRAPTGRARAACTCRATVTPATWSASSGAWS